MPIPMNDPLPEGVTIEADGSWVVKGVKIAPSQMQALVEGLTAKGIALPVHPPDQPWAIIKAVAQRLGEIADKQDRAGLVQAVLELIGYAPDALELREQQEEAAGDSEDDVPVVQQQGLADAGVAAGHVRQEFRLESHNSNQDGKRLLVEGQRFGEALRLRDGLRDGANIVGASVVGMARSLHRKVKAVDNAVADAATRNHALAQACAPIRRYLTERHEKSASTRRGNEVRDAQVRAEITEELYDAAKAAAKAEVRSDLAGRLDGAFVPTKPS